MIKLLERESDLLTIRGFARRGGLLVVEGRAGIGKTALLDAACATAQRNGRAVLRARGSDLESGFSFGIVRQLFERRCTEASRKERAALFRGVAGSARALMMRDGTNAQAELYLSALASIADIKESWRHFSVGPGADIA